mgnify:CR=1 FL=1
MLLRRTVLSSLIATAAFAQASVGEAFLKHGFNDAEINWRTYQEGIPRAQSTQKPVLFLAHATWCPHCTAYRSNFFDPAVVRRIAGFVPVLIDTDANPEINQRYAPDGAYVPRTMVLTPQGKLMTDVTGPGQRYRWFLDYGNVRELIEFLDRGLDAFERQGT